MVTVLICFMAKSSWLKKNTSYVEGFLRAVTKAVKYINETQPSIVAPYLTDYFEGVSTTSIAASIQRYREIDSWRTELSMTEDSFNRLQDIIENAGELSRRASMSELVNNDYAKKVYGEIYNK